MNIKKILNWLPDISLVILLGGMYFFIDDIRQNLYLLREHVNDEQSFNFAIATLDGKITQLFIFCVFFIGTFNLVKRIYKKPL